MTHLSPPPTLMQVRPPAALMEVDDAVTGPGVRDQGQVSTGGPSGLAGGRPSSDSGRRRGRSANKSGDESGGDSSRMDLGGASSGEEGSTGYRGGTPGSSGYGGSRKGAGGQRKKVKRGAFGSNRTPSPPGQVTTPVAFSSSPPASASTAKPRSAAAGLQRVAAATPLPCPPTGSATPGSAGSPLLAGSAQPSPARHAALSRTPNGAGAVGVGAVGAATPQDAAAAGVGGPTAGFPNFGAPVCSFGGGRVIDGGKGARSIAVAAAAAGQTSVMVHHQQVPHVRSSMKQVGEQVVLREARQLMAIKAGLKGIGLPNERQLLPLLLAACRAAGDISLDALLTAVPWLRLVVSDQPMTIALLFEHATSEEMAASSRNDMYLSFLSKKEGLSITNTDTGGLRRLDNLRDDLLQDAGWREVRTAMDDLLEGCKRSFLTAMSYSGLAGDLWVHASFGVQKTFEQRCQLSASVFAAPQVLCL